MPNIDGDIDSAQYRRDRYRDRDLVDPWSKKAIAIFSYKQWLLSIDMKTKLVQHVESDWMREWESVRVWECESERVIFEHRHENKTCSACWECVNERVKEWESDRMRECERVIWFPAFVWRSDIFNCFLQIPGKKILLRTYCEIKYFCFPAMTSISVTLNQA